MNGTPIAVVGAGALFPGSSGASGFWQNVLAKTDNVTDVPESHWRVSDYYDADPKAPDKTYARRGAFLSPTAFDALAWGIPPSIVPATDTSQLLALIVAQQVLDDVGRHGARTIDKRDVSVILGVTGAQELLGSLVSRLQRPVWERSLRDMGLDEPRVKEACDRIAAHYVPWQEASFPGLLGNVVAGRIANRLDLGGTNCITDAACASALAAVHLAMNELMLGQSRMVITGGVDTLNDIFMYMCFSKTPALSHRGDCRPFDVDADGTLLGEGIGMLALKRLEHAEADGDHVYAVIRGMGTSSDGRSKSVYAPVSEGQARALTKAYAHAGYSPRTVELVEAHGTATKAGDLAEINGLKMAFASEDGASQWCALGSVKSQIGHTKAAAGAAGLMKIVLALHHKVLPPTIKVTKPNPAADFGKSPFYINTEARPWIRAADHPRRAGVSSFGFGGSNFHVTAEEYRGPAARPPRMDPPGPELLVFSADTREALLAAVEDARGKDLAAAAIASQRAFDPKRAWRLGGVAQPGKGEETLDRMLAAARGDKAVSRGGVWFVPNAAPGRVAFLFSGQGSQRVDMAAPLAMRFDAVREAIDAFDTAVPGLGRVLYPQPRFDTAERAADEATLTRTEWAQPAIGAVSVGVLALLRACGLDADAFAGHSFGELTALQAAGTMDVPTLARAARARGERMAAASSTPGAMAAVLAGPEAVQPLLAPGAVLANLNAPEQTVIAGTRTSVDATVARAEEAGLRCQPLNVATAFHSPLVAPAGQELTSYLKSETLRPPARPVYANATAAPYGAGADVATLLGEHLRSPVRFVEQVTAMWQDGVRTFIEVGPGATLTSLVGRILAGKPHQAFATVGKEGDPSATFLGALAYAAALGLPVRLAALHADRVAPVPAAPPRMAVDICGTNHGKPWPAAATPPVPANESPRGAFAERERAASPSSAPVSSLAAPSPSTSVAPQVNGASSTAPVASPPSPSVRKETPVSNAPTPDPWIAAFLESQRQSAEVHERFQRAMTDAHVAFLRSQEEATRAIVALAGGSPVTTAAFSATVQPATVAVPPASVTVTPVTVAPASVTVAPTPAPAVLAVPAPARPAPVAVAPPSPVPASVQPPRAAVAVPAPPAPKPVAAPAPAQVRMAAPVPAAPAANANAGLAQVLLDVVADKTGYPVEMLRLDMNLEADLGIDSIKRVEILSALREKAPDTPEADADTMGGLKTLGQIVGFLGGAAPAAVVVPAPAPAQVRMAAPVPAAPAANANAGLAQLLLDVVADKTGYPVEMLRLDMNLEADLGIDSIKRVEILSALREKAPDTPEADADTMGGLKTLGQIVGFLGGAAPAAVVVPAPAQVRVAPMGPVQVRVASPAPAAPGEGDLAQLLLDVVADKTGYPVEMLRLDMNLEADLGIDSIKRVEILSALREKAPDTPEADADTMGGLKTLGQIVGFLGGAEASPRPF